MSKVNTQKNSLEVYLNTLQRARDTVIQYRSILIQLHRRIPYNITELDRIIDVEIERLRTVETTIETELKETDKKLLMVKHKYIGTVYNKEDNWQMLLIFDYPYNKYGLTEYSYNKDIIAAFKEEAIKSMKLDMRIYHLLPENILEKIQPPNISGTIIHYIVVCDQLLGEKWLVSNEKLTDQYICLGRCPYKEYLRSRYIMDKYIQNVLKHRVLYEQYISNNEWPNEWISKYKRNISSVENDKIFNKTGN